MRIRSILLPIAAAFILFHLPALAGETITAMGQGEAVKGEADDVKEVARGRALADAVMKGLYETAEKMSLRPAPSAESLILSDPLKFIVNYKILSERWVAEGEEAPAQEEVPSPEEPYAYEEPGTEPPVDSEPADSEPLFEAREEGGYVFDTGPEGTVYRVLVEAAVDVNALRGALTPGAATGGLSLKLVLLDIPDWETFSALLKKLREETLIEDVTYSSFAPGRFVLSAKTSGDIKEIRAAIAGKTGEEFVVVLLEPDTIVIKANPIIEDFEAE